ncbi:hypothetical protein HGM15179_000939 [Zosterops borbonicus]|uniref:Uncharacterized protein n=1 Tax=Zosterops borbonicus TaxID=364589 RepID=A0A8K1LUA1_9PASS|nr:hypothetical protein HGM15179_000939 [Zosterops borbonicus]
MEVSKLVSDLKQKLQHEEEGVGPVVGAGRWGGGNRHLGRDTWLWGAEQGWLGQEALRGEDVVPGRQDGCGDESDILIPQTGILLPVMWHGVEMDLFLMDASHPAPLEVVQRDNCCKKASAGAEGFVKR